MDECRGEIKLGATEGLEGKAFGDMGFGDMGFGDMGFGDKDTKLGEIILASSARPSRSSAESMRA